jgi:hypothetical protein
MPVCIEIDRSRDNAIEVTFNMTTSAFEAAAPVLKIVSGEMEPPFS